jgi:hypothetical protein
VTTVKPDVPDVRFVVAGFAGAVLVLATVPAEFLPFLIALFCLYTNQKWTHR